MTGTGAAVGAGVPTDGRLEQLDVHKGGVLGMGGETTSIPGAGIASVGADVVVVRTTSPDVVVVRTTPPND